jgi:NADPH:quinone reductase-like Zn-dependent oxidoreductase
MRIEQIPVPEVRPTDVLVNVKACSIVPNLANAISNIHRFPDLYSLRFILAVRAICNQVPGKWGLYPGVKTPGSLRIRHLQL